jgi:hypothetical protein
LGGKPLAQKALGSDAIRRFALNVTTPIPAGHSQNNIHHTKAKAGAPVGIIRYPSGTARHAGTTKQYDLLTQKPTINMISLF